MSVSNTTKRVKEIRRKTRRKFSSEEKIRIVLGELRGVVQIQNYLNDMRYTGIKKLKLYNPFIGTEIAKYVVYTYSPPHQPGVAR
jgi:hypothetical protein